MLHTTPKTPSAAMAIPARDFESYFFGRKRRVSLEDIAKIKIDRDRRGYDVKLNNGMEIEFDKKFNVVDIDD